VVRGVSLPSPIDLTRRPYNTGHTTVWPCERERHMRETHCKRLCPCTRGTFRARILTILSRSVMTTIITLLNKPYSVYCVLIQSSDTLLQIIHFNVMLQNIYVSQGKAVTWVRLGGKYLYIIHFQPLCHLPTKTY